MSLDVFVAIATLASTAALVAVTSYYAWQNHRMVAEMQATRELQTRPIVELLLEPDAWSTNVLRLTLANVGNGPARDVHCTFDPDPPYRLSSDATTLSQLGLFNGAQLGTGQRISIFFDVFANYWNLPNAPRSFRSTASYKGATDTLYTTVSVIDVQMLFGTSITASHPLKDISKHLGDVSKFMSEVAGKAKDHRDYSWRSQSSGTILSSMWRQRARRLISKLRRASHN